MLNDFKSPFAVTIERREQVAGLFGPLLFRVVYRTSSLDHHKWPAFPFSALVDNGRDSISLEHI